MPRLFWLSLIIAPLAAIITLVFASGYIQQPLRSNVVPGEVAPEGHMDTSIPTLFSMADIHGDYPKALAALVHAGVVDENGDWNAGNSTFVQTGDIVDRGPDTQKIYKWMRTLTAQAASQGGRVIKLWGNHEYMNAMHDWRYVHPGDLSSFPAPHEKTRLEAFSLNGSIGSDWMLDYGVTYLDPIMKAHFMHAGLSYEHVSTFSESVGIGFMKKLLSGRRSRMYWSHAEDAFWSNTGPMWYRGYATHSEEGACDEATKVMKVLGAEFLVMGHTPNFSEAIVRCGGRVILIDTGLSSAYGGRPVVLEMGRKLDGGVEVKLHYDDVKSRHIVEVLPLV